MYVGRVPGTQTGFERGLTFTRRSLQFLHPFRDFLCVLRDGMVAFAGLKRCQIVTGSRQVTMFVTPSLSATAYFSRQTGFSFLVLEWTDGNACLSV